MIFRPLRLAPVLLFIIAAAWFLPTYWQRAFMGDRYSVSGHFSPVSKEFIRWETGPTGISFVTEEGKVLPVRRARMQMPFIFNRDMVKWKAFPLTLDGRSFDAEEASLVQRVRINPRAVAAGFPIMHMLVEGAPETASLDLASDVLIFGKNSVRFVRCYDGTVNKAKSAQFNKAILEAGVKFPIGPAVNNPDPNKSFDEGLFFVDAGFRLFNLALREGKGICRDTGITVPGQVRFMNVKEDVRREYYGLLATDDALYLNMYGGRLEKLPVEGFNPSEHWVEMRSTPLYRTFNISRRNDSLAPPVLMVATNNANNTVRTHTASLPQVYIDRQILVQKGLSFLAPFTLAQFEPSSAGVVLKVRPAQFPLYALLGSLVWMGLYLLIRRSRPTLEHSLALIIITVSGLPGLLGTLLFSPLIERRG